MVAARSRSYDIFESCYGFFLMISACSGKRVSIVGVLY